MEVFFLILIYTLVVWVIGYLMGHSDRGTTKIFNDRFK